MLKNLHTQPRSNSKVGKYNSVFRNWDQYAVSAGWWLKKKNRMKVENQYSPASAYFGLQMLAFWNINAWL